MARSCCLTAIGRLATLDVAPHGVDVRPAAARDTAAAEALGVLNDAALVIEGENVVWIGAAADAPAADEVVDCGSQLVVPGFVDCHTHLVFGGDRSGEFVRRTQGES
ncbi:MAG: hypothetical protein KC609_06645, partial [Myxococcales bacterium]|nr:hypothetical protein [Myxococcales bacterium]